LAEPGNYHRWVADEQLAGSVPSGSATLSEDGTTSERWVFKVAGEWQKQ
jgi:hypothetical protein